MNAVVNPLVVLGSLTTDHAVWVDYLPRAEESVLASHYTVALGGKGFNQAVTAARQGAPVAMVGCVGDDEDGDWLLAALEDEGIEATHVGRHTELPTGRAHIIVEDSGTNATVVVPGANDGVSCPAETMEGASVLLAQLECPVSEVAAAFAAARSAGVITVLNPSPAQPLTPEVLGLVDYLVANEEEASMLPLRADPAFMGTLIITEGERGARVSKGGREKRLPPIQAGDAVDPTAAGDAFCGTLAAGLALGMSFGVILYRAAAAGGHAVTLAGALPSLPTAADVDLLLSRLG